MILTLLNLLGCGALFLVGAMFSLTNATHFGVNQAIGLTMRWAAAVLAVVVIVRAVWA